MKHAPQKQPAMPTVRNLKHCSAIVGTMTQIIGVVDRDDVIVAGDCALNDCAGKRISDECLKSVCLNNKLCAIFAGGGAATAVILSALTRNDYSSSPNDCCTLWEKSKDRVTYDYGQAKEIIAHVLPFVYESCHNSGKEACIVILAGRDKDGPVLCRFAEHTICGEETHSGHMYSQGFPLGGKLQADFVATVDGDKTTYKAEQRMVDAIRNVARATDHEWINERVVTRRLSRRFKANLHRTDPA